MKVQDVTDPLTDAPRLWIQSDVASALPITLPCYFVFYDGNCRICTRSRRMIQRLRTSADLVFVDAQDPAAMRPFPILGRDASLGQIHVLNPAGELAGGYDGLLALVPALPTFRPLHPLLRWRPVRALGAKVYRWIARNRYRIGGSVSCENGACRIS